MLSGPLEAVGGAFGWIKSKIPGRPTHSDVSLSMFRLENLPVELGFSSSQWESSMRVIIDHQSVVEIYDDVNSHLAAGLRNASNDDNYFQPLSGGNEDFDVDEADAESPVRRS